MDFIKSKKVFEKPEVVSKKCSKLIADNTTEKVYKNLKENKVKY